MFTGIVEEVGTVARTIGAAGNGSISIAASRVLQGTNVGDSIAVNGVCLTVTAMTGKGFTADVMAETLRRSNLGELKAGSPVNLERAMPGDGRFGGHLVSGHIDGTGRVLDQRREGNAVWIKIEAPQGILALIIEKGSVAIDGVSLTVAEAGERWFQVSVIPHTGAETTLLSGERGRRVNLENDMVGKYIQRLLCSSLGEQKPQRKEEGRNSGALSLQSLIENGF